MGGSRVGELHAETVELRQQASELTRKAVSLSAQLERSQDPNLHLEFDAARRELERTRQEVTALTTANAGLEKQLRRMLPAERPHAGIDSYASRTQLAFGRVDSSSASLASGSVAGDIDSDGAEAVASVQVELFRKQLKLARGRIKENQDQVVLLQARARALEAHVAFLRTDNRRLAAAAARAGSPLPRRTGDYGDGAQTLVGRPRDLDPGALALAARPDVDAERNVTEQFIVSIGQELQQALVERDESRAQLRGAMDHRDELVAQLRQRVADDARGGAGAEQEIEALKEDVSRLTLECVPRLVRAHADLRRLLALAHTRATAWLTRTPPRFALCRCCWVSAGTPGCSRCTQRPARNLNRPSPRQHG